MQPAAQIVWVLAFALLLLALLGRAGWLRLAVPVFEADRSGPGSPGEEGDEDQLPETDRAPRRRLHALTYAVALTAAVRVGLLVTLHR